MARSDDPQQVWKREDPGLPKASAEAEICRLARNRERESLWMRRISAFALVCFVIAFAHNIWIVPQTWVRLGQGWMLAVVSVALWGLIRKAPDRQAANETCAEFVMRSMAGRRDGYRALGRSVVLIVPSVLASWYGGGAALRARTMGLDPASAYYRYLTSGWPFVISCVLLVVIWLAFRESARKLGQELEAVRERIAAM